MTVAIHSNPKFKFFLPGTNQLAVGAKLFTYEVGTTTKKTSYQDFDKNTANTNPVILDANGECTLWLDGKYKLVLAPSNDTDPPASPYWTLDDVGDEDVTASVAGVSNRIPNGSAETDTDSDGVPDDWSFTAGTGNTLTVDTTENFHGTSCFKFVIASANTAIAETTLFEVQEAQEEVLAFALKASAVDANVVVRLVWYTDAQVFISNTDVYSDSSSNPTSWTDNVISFTPPTNARYAKLQLRVATTGKTVYIDNIRSQTFEGKSVAQTVSGLWTFSDNSCVIGGITASDLVDKSATETITGAWSLSSSSCSINGITASDLVDKSATETVTGAWTLPSTTVIGGITASNLIEKDDIARGALASKNNQTISDSVSAILAFQNETYDTDSIHDTSTNDSRMTVPTGVTKIVLSANISIANSGTGYRSAYFLKNGSSSSFVGNGQIRFDGSSGTTRFHVQSSVLTVTGGDYFEIEFFQDSGGNLTVYGGDSHTWFSMEILK